MALSFTDIFDSWWDSWDLWRCGKTTEKVKTKKRLNKSPYNRHSIGDYKIAWQLGKIVEPRRSSILLKEEFTDFNFLVISSFLGFLFQWKSYFLLQTSERNLFNECTESVCKEARAWVCVMFFKLIFGLSLSLNSRWLGQKKWKTANRWGMVGWGAPGFRPQQHTRTMNQHADRVIVLVPIWPRIPPSSSSTSLYFFIFRCRCFFFFFTIISTILSWLYLHQWWWSSSFHSIN